MKSLKVIPPTCLDVVCRQLEESHQKDEKQKSEEPKDDEDQEIPAEDNAIEMTDDFDGKIHDGDKEGHCEIHCVLMPFFAARRSDSF